MNLSLTDRIERPIMLLRLTQILHCVGARMAAKVDKRGIQSCIVVRFAFWPLQWPQL